MNKIAIFGGSFDPVHNGHIRIAAQALSRLNLNKVIFVPAYIQPFKLDAKQASSTDRYNMLNLATKDEPLFEVSDYEICNKGISYSYQTAEHFKSIYINSKLYFIIGDDAYADIDSWKEADRLKKAVDFIVFPRLGNILVRDAIYIDIPPDKISSTNIRELLKSGKDVSNLMPEGVLQYIKTHNLYKE